MANILAFAETRDSIPRKVALEAITAARMLADATGGGEVHELMMGASGVSEKSKQLGEYGADVVYLVENAALANYNPEVAAATTADRAKQGGYRAIVFSTSAQGRDLAPRVAAKLDAGIVTDVTSFRVDGD